MMAMQTSTLEPVSWPRPPSSELAQLAAVQECVKECERYNPLGYCGPICAAAVDLGTALIGGVSCSNASDVYELASEFKPIDSFFSFQMQQ